MAYSVPVQRPTHNGELDAQGHIVSHPWIQYRQLYRTSCLPDAEWQRQYLEMLRYRWRYHVTDARYMQRLGTLGRSLMTFILGRID